MRTWLPHVVAAIILMTAATLSIQNGAVLSAPQEGETFFEVAPQGFGDPYNNGTWSMEWWKGDLYVGTVRSIFCWSQLALNQNVPGIPYPPGDEEYDCLPDIHDIPLQAEIWKRESDTGAWIRVFRSPLTVPDPDEPGSFIAREVGLRDMAVVIEPDGTEALYVGSVFPHILYPDDPPPPRLLRSTDGLNWLPVPQDTGTTLGEVENPSFSRLTADGERLYMLKGTIQGDGPVLYSRNPAAGNNAFVHITPPEISVFEMIFYNGHLYLGTNTELDTRRGSVLHLPLISSGQQGVEHASTPVTTSQAVAVAPTGGAEREGFSVLKADVSGEPPYEYAAIIRDGADLYDRPSRSVVSMEEYDGRLYIGTDTPAEIVRLNPDDSWDLIVGTPRTYDNGVVRNPMSGLDQGFGWFLNVHMWRMQAYEGKLYVGTADESTRFRDFPILPPGWPDKFGFDLWYTSDGVLFSPITENGFGDIFQAGVRTFAATPLGLFMGTVNFWDGMMVYLKLPESAAAAAAVTTPTRLMVEELDGHSLLSWDRAADAATYHVYRATFISNREAGIAEVDADAWVPTSAFEQVATTTDFFYLDPSSQPTERYLYYVVAEGQTGLRSDASNVVQGPAIMAAPTWSEAEATLLGWRSGNALTARSRQAVSDPLAEAEALVRAGHFEAARQMLLAIADRVRDTELLPEWRDSDVRRVLHQLSRRLTLVEQGVLPMEAME